MEATFRIADRLVGVGKDDSGCPYGDRDQAWLHNAGPHGTGRLVPCAADDWDSGGEADEIGSLRTDLAGDVWRFDTPGHPIRRDSEFLQDLLAPSAPTHVQQYRARGI